jgi:hypothetical protein
LLFNFTAVQINCEVGLHAKGVVIIIAAENNFCHHLASGAIVLRFIFEAQVIKAINDRIKFLSREGTFAVAVNSSVPVAAVSKRNSILATSSTG